MKFSIVCVALVSSLVGGSIHATLLDEDSANVIVRIGDAAKKKSGKRQIFIMSDVPLSNVKLRQGGDSLWMPFVPAVAPSNLPEAQAYVSEPFVDVKLGRKFEIRAEREDGTRFTDKIELVKGVTKPRAVVTAFKEETPEEVKKAKASDWRPVRDGSYGGYYKNCWDYVNKTGGHGRARYRGPTIPVMKLRPGSVLLLNNFHWGNHHGQNHWVRVEYADWKGNVTFSHSNTSGYHGKRVNTIPVSHFSGWVTLY